MPNRSSDSVLTSPNVLLVASDRLHRPLARVNLFTLFSHPHSILHPLRFLHKGKSGYLCILAAIDILLASGQRERSSQGPILS